jgi:hypothetical protein
VPRPTRDLDQAVPVEHGVDRALGRNPDVAVQSADQELADLTGTPMGLVALGRDDQALDLPRQLVGVANRPARTVGQGLASPGKGKGVTHVSGTICHLSLGPLTVRT